MSRLQKKCLVLSIAAHGTLMGAMVLLSAFRPAPPREEPLEVLHLVNLNPDRLIDEAFAGGGSPGPLQPPAKETQPDPVPTPPPASREPPRAAPEPAKPASPPPEPARIEPKPEPKPEPGDTPEVVDLKPKPKPKPEKFVLTPIKASTRKPPRDTETEERAAEQNRRAEARARAEAIDEARANALKRWSQNLDRSMDRLEGNLSSGVSVQISGGTGTGGTGGGESYANWNAYVKMCYERAFVVPADSSRSLSVLVKVTIARDGQVLSDRILRKSGDDEYDRAVAEALSRVRQVRPFPEKSTDTRRELTITFIPPKDN